MYNSVRELQQAQRTAGECTLIASRLVLYMPVWQAVRVSLQGYWTSSRGVTSNLETLREYLKGYRSDLDKFVRLWQILNCLNAVRMGYSGQGLTGSDQDQMVREFRNRISQEYHRLRSTYHRHLDKAVPTARNVRASWKRLDPELRRSINDDLQRRLTRSSGTNRDELRWFLEVVEGV